MFELEVERFTRVCAETGREFQVGEPVYSTLSVRSGQVVRRDYCQSAWQARATAASDGPETPLGWWQWTVPDPQRSKPRWAPRDVLLDFFEQTEQLPDQQDTRYMLALLLLRRRLLREPHETEPGPRDATTWRLDCPSRQVTYTVHVTPPSADRLPAVEAELHKLLDGDDS